MRRWIMGAVAALVVVVAVGAGARAIGRAERLNAQGRAAMTKGDYRAAAAAFGEAVRIKPDVSKYHYNLGLAFGNMRHLDSAEIQFREALRLSPGDVDASRALSVTRARMEVRAQP